MVTQLMECAYYSLQSDVPTPVRGGNSDQDTTAATPRQSPPGNRRVDCVQSQIPWSTWSDETRSAGFVGWAVDAPSGNPTAGDYVHETTAAPDEGEASSAAVEEDKNPGEKDSAQDTAADERDARTPLGDTNPTGDTSTDKTDYDLRGKDSGNAPTKEELPDWSDPAGDVAPVTPPSSPYEATGAGKQPR